MVKLHYSPSSLVLFFLLSSLQMPFYCSSSQTKLHEMRHSQRLDPLNGFKVYNGAYDIRSKHYWGSAVFTGAHGFAMAGLWTLGGIVLLATLPVWKKSFVGSPVSHAETCRNYWHLLPLIAVLLFALAASGVALIAAHKFHRKAKKPERALLGAARASFHAICRVLHTVEEVRTLLQSYDAGFSALLGAAALKLRAESAAIRKAMREDGALVDAVLGLTYGATLGIVCLTLILFIAEVDARLPKMTPLKYSFTIRIFMNLSHVIYHSFPSAILMRSRPGLIIIVVICWLLTSACWILCGFHFFLRTYIEDTCLELDQYMRDPSSSILSSILPCPDSSAADYIMAKVGFNIHNFIIQLNSNISDLIQTADAQEQHEGQQFRLICNPFLGAPNYRYDPTKCSNESITINDMSMELEINKHLLPTGSYAMLSSYTYSTQSIVGALADVEKLIHCSFLKDAFDDILHHHCVPLKDSILLLWSTMITLSISLVILEVAWLAKEFHNRRRQLNIPM